MQEAIWLFCCIYRSLLAIFLHLVFHIPCQIICMVRNPLQIADNIQKYHSCGGGTFSGGKTLNVFFPQFLLLIIHIILILADLANRIHIAGLPGINGMLKGFVSVEAAPFGGEQGYLDLSSIHVSWDMRGRGVGRALFAAAKEWAGDHGGRKLYISAHSAVESQAFYKAMGCVEAQVYHPGHVEAEPCDCQLECAL